MPVLRKYAVSSPDKIAVRISESGALLDYRTLDLRSARLSHYLVSRGLVVGDAIAILLENSLNYFEVTWAARRAGLYYVPISTHLTSSEVEYILQDSGAQILFIAEALLAKLGGLSAGLRDRVSVVVVGRAQDQDGNLSYSKVLEGEDLLPALVNRPPGRDFSYSSGTTGQPKGIKQPISDGIQPKGWPSYFDLSPETVYLSPAPLYHAAPLRLCMRCIAAGGTALVMMRFDAREALEAIARYRVTHSQWVPTMFVRMLALPEKVRNSVDLSSMRRAVHAAAPCPRDVKLKMLEWWGPIIWEYYAGSEGNGTTLISPHEWLTHQGSVGRAVTGKVHIVSEDGHICPPRVEGLVYFSDGPKFEYHKDPQKTAAAHNEHGWSTIGDIGYLDEDEYLYLTDRKANMIISGGVNIYPQEAENLLQTHPAVADVAVFGIPNNEYGEEVAAVVQLMLGFQPSEALSAELIAFCRDNLSHIKCPRRVDFTRELPRTETGKLLKRVIRDQYRDQLKLKDGRGTRQEDV